MNTTLPVVTAAVLLAGGVTAQSAPKCAFEVAVEPANVTFVLDVGTPALGGIILSLSPELRHYFVGLPPMLGDFAVLAVGPVDARMVLKIPEGAFAPGVFFYAQGIAANEYGICASAVDSFVLDGSVVDPR